MKKAALCLFLAWPAFGAMFRVVTVRDSRTIVVAGADGVQRPVVLRGVEVPRELEADAVAHLRRIVERTWVLVENGGDVYRSPDVLFVNGEMMRRAWRTGPPMMTYHGELDLGPREATVKPAAKPASRGKAASPAKSPRSGRARSGRAPSRP